MLPPLILASQSPRRKALLSTIGVDFNVVCKETPELFDAQSSPQELCLHNAQAKADAVFKDHPYATVIGADTLVFLDGEPLGKPLNLAEAKQMLRRLSGKTHYVCTAVALVSPLGKKNLTPLTKVQFKQLSDEVILNYLNLVNVLDKAGAYAFQEHGEMIIENVEGDTNNVIGLPLADLTQVLQEWNYPVHTI